MPTGMYSAITVGSTSSGSITFPVVIPWWMPSMARPITSGQRNESSRIQNSDKRPASRSVLAAK